MYAVLPARITSTFDPRIVIVPPPSPFVMLRSSPIVCPTSWIVPETRTLSAARAACLASARIAAALFEDSPFEPEPPQPASVAARRRRSASGRRLPIEPPGTLQRAEDASIAPVHPRGIHHVGVAVENLDEAVQTYERLFGGRLEHRARVEEQGVEAATMRVGDGRIELLAALGEDTPVGRFLAKRGPGMHHVAYEVEDVAAALEELNAEGAELIDEAPRRGLFGLEVAFVHPDAVHGVLAEIVSGG